ncbi:hypothetical protein QBC39DRAFT_22431 [Podospora conica]|nr:hypothetical protein QBC39DRAFT_22431 [Schizothecium conicum]
MTFYLRGTPSSTPHSFLNYHQPPPQWQPSSFPSSRWRTAFATFRHLAGKLWQRGSPRHFFCLFLPRFSVFLSSFRRRLPPSSRRSSPPVSSSLVVAPTMATTAPTAAGVPAAAHTTADHIIRQAWLYLRFGGPWPRGILLYAKALPFGKPGSTYVSEAPGHGGSSYTPKPSRVWAPSASWSTGWGWPSPPTSTKSSPRRPRQPSTGFAAFRQTLPALPQHRAYT